METFKFYYAFFILLLLINGGCQSDQTLSKHEAEIIVEEVTNTLMQYHRDIRADGVLAELKYLDTTDQFSWMAPGYNSALNYDSVVSILKLMQPLYNKVEHSWDSLSVTPQSKSLATYTGIINSVLTNLHGQSDSMKLREEGIIIRRQDGWKLLSGKTRVIH